MSSNPYAPPTTRVEDIPGTGAAGVPMFFPVSLLKFTVMSLATLGMYSIFWFYRNWSLVRQREGLSIIPAMRALFAIFFCYALLARVRKAAVESGIQPPIAAGPLAAGWIVCTLTSRLPEPYVLLVFLAFIFLLPVQAQVNRINAAVVPGMIATAASVSGTGSPPWRACCSMH